MEDIKGTFIYVVAVRGRPLVLHEPIMSQVRLTHKVHAATYDFQ